ncbi:MAG: large subunit ribosomal protein [Thermoleophilaceae bacterium]|nr:large subunit ribosomal protein [Thermoleophilaceae bacterium]
MADEEKQKKDAAEAAEEQPAEAKPKRRRRKKADEAEAAPAAEATAAGDSADADDAKKAADQEEAEAEAAEAEGEPEPEEDDGTPAEKPTRRRGASEVTAGRKKATPARRDAAGAVAVRAKAKYVRCAPRKARLVIDHIRGKPVDQARAILLHTPRAASRDVLKLLDSAIANAENNHELVADELVVGQAFVDEGPTLKRYRPRALGRATRIRKRTSHMTITLTTSENGS